LSNSDCARFRQRPIRANGTHPIVTFENIESAFRYPRADDAVGVQPQSGHAVGVCGHMRLAHQPATHTGAAQMIAHGLLAQLKGGPVPAGPVAVDVSPRIGRQPRRTTKGCLHIGTGKLHTLLRKAVDVGCLDMLGAIAA
jgi:hypothetical protein